MRRRVNAQAERGARAARALCAMLALCTALTPAQAEPVANGSGAIAGPPKAKSSIQTPPPVANAAPESTPDTAHQATTPQTDAAQPAHERGDEPPARRGSGSAVEAKMPLGVPRDQALRLGGLNPNTSTAPRDAATSTRTVNVRDGWLMGTLLPLLVVVALIAACAWGFRQIAKRGGGLAGAMGAGGRAPSGILFVLGRYPVSRGMTLVLLQIDRRVLLLMQTARPPAMSTLCEITEPSEVASILSKARDSQGESIAAKFQGLVRAAEKQLENEPYEGASLPVRGAAPAHVTSRKPLEIDATQSDEDLSASESAVAAVRRGPGGMLNAAAGTKSGAMRDLLAAMRADGARSGGGQ